jgi:hypothetical protein
MSNSANSIIWMKWKDPLGKNQNEFEYIPEKDVENYDNTFNDDDEDEDDMDDPDIPTPVVITPLGILPLKPFNDPTKVYNFWLGETNFDITKKVAKTINKIPGVEILDIFTRYKFRIAVGNNFTFQDVRQNIEQQLNAVPCSKKKKEVENMPLDDDTKAQLHSLIQIQLSKFKKWAVYVLPNRKVDMVASDENTPEFEERIEIYRLARKLAGGAILKHDEQII